MLKRYTLAAVMVGLAALIFHAPAAQADTVLYDSSGFIQGRQSFVQQFDMTVPGTVTVTLSDIAWPDLISNLSWFLSSATGTLSTSMGPGTDTFNVGPGLLYAHWSGDANGASGLGVFGIKISFEPSVAAVPLPGSGSLLLSGLIALLGWQFRSTLIAAPKAVTKR